MLGLHPEHETWIVLKKKLTRYKVNFVAQSSNQALVTSRFSFQITGVKTAQTTQQV